MFTELYDISCTLDEGTLVYPGDAGFALTQECDVQADGSGYRLSTMRMSAHLGTHLDAPRHFLKDADSIDLLAPRRFLLPALVVDVPWELDRITGEFVSSLNPVHGQALLFRTRNGASLVRREWLEDFCCLSEEGARILVEAGTALVGIDWLSIESYEDPSFPVHHILLRGEVLILENCVLNDVPAGPYQLIALPLKIAGGDGSPVRAVLAR